VICFVVLYKVSIDRVGTHKLAAIVTHHVSNISIKPIRYKGEDVPVSTTP